MGSKCKFAGAVAIILFISISCGNKRNMDSDFQVSPDILEIKKTPEMQGAITDNEGIFDKMEKERLIQKINLMESEYNIPIYVLTTATFEPFESFTEYSDEVGARWDYCKDEEGILFVISSYMGELRVITCTKTESRISEKDFEYMINDILYDSFRKESFEGGLIKAMDFLESIITAN